MSSLDIAASPPLRRDETVQIAPLLTFAGGYLDACIYSSVMITGNLRQAIEGVFTAFSGSSESGMLRRSGIFTAVCIAFGMGAAVGAYATKNTPGLSLGLPVMALLIVLFRCEIRPNEERR